METKGVSKTMACQQAFDQALKEAQLSQSEIENIWADFEHLINTRTGYPYDFIVVKLPREKRTKQPVANPDLITIPDTEFEFSRARFYNNRDFQRSLRTYYRQFNCPIKLFETHTGWILKIFMR